MGFTSSMNKSIKDNSRLRKRSGLFSQLKEEPDREEGYKRTSVSKEELIELRSENRKRIKNDRLVRIVIGILVLVPLIVCLIGVVYLFFEGLFR